MVFIDNYSRFCWFYPLKLKSEFFEVFQIFQKLVENQFCCKIKSFQCDGGGEFTSKVFQHHLEQNGIKQLMSYPHTPQQNGLAERKHVILWNSVFQCCFKANCHKDTGLKRLQLLIFSLIFCLLQPYRITCHLMRNCLAKLLTTQP